MEEKGTGLVMLSRWLPPFRPSTLISVITTLQFLLYWIGAFWAHAFAPNTCSLHLLRGIFAPDIALRLQLDRVVFPVLLHSSLVPMLFTTSMQLRIGNELQDYYGKSRFYLLFCLSGFLGSAAAAVYDTYAVMGGASSALFGLLGSQGAILAVSKAPNSQFLEQLSFYFASVFVPFCLTSMWPHSTIAGHLVGLISGFLLGIGLQKERKCNFPVRILAWLLWGALVYFLYFEMWTIIDFLDCEFSPYTDRSGAVHYSGMECERLCQDY